MTALACFAVDIIFMQTTFQLVLSTNGNASFAALMYQDPTTLTDFPREHVVGFDAGDRNRGITFMPNELQGANVFRIDGK